MSDELTRAIAEALGCVRREASFGVYCATHMYRRLDECDAQAEAIAAALAPLIEARVREAESRAHRQAETNVRWNLANLIGFTIDQGRLDGTDGQRVAAAIRASTSPEEFAAACNAEESRNG